MPPFLWQESSASQLPTGAGEGTSTDVQFERLDPSPATGTADEGEVEPWITGIPDTAEYSGTPQDQHQHLRCPHCHEVLPAWFGSAV